MDDDAAAAALLVAFCVCMGGMVEVSGTAGSPLYLWVSARVVGYFSFRPSPRVSSARLYESAVATGRGYVRVWLVAGLRSTKVSLFVAWEKAHWSAFFGLLLLLLFVAVHTMYTACCMSKHVLFF